MSGTPIPENELKVFESLKNVRVVFDVGARYDVDYLTIKPEIELHAFEPNPEFFLILQERVGKRTNVYLNNYGLGDKKEELPYDPSTQSFLLPVTNPKLPIKTLDWYVKENNITKIDFLKIDTEGWDYKVLVGGSDILSNTHYIQYEHWDDKGIFHILLENDFDMEYMGYRNVLCLNKKLVSQKTRDKIISFIRDNKF